MFPRGLDDRGWHVLDAWSGTASASDRSRVLEVVEAIAWGHDWRVLWRSTRADSISGADGLDRHDWYLEPRPGLVMLIREYSDTNPESEFSILAIDDSDLGPENDGW